MAEQPNPGDADELTNDEFRRQLGDILQERRERRAAMLEIADGALLEAISILDNAKLLHERGISDIGTDLEALAERLEGVELDMRRKAQEELETIAIFAERGQLAARERDVVDELLALAKARAEAPGADPDPEVARLTRIRSIIEAERRRIEALGPDL